MESEKIKINLTKQKQKTNNKRWTDIEIKHILEYLQEQHELEKPTAQIFYKKLLEKTHIDATWDLVKWKVKHLKLAYKKAEEWRKSTGAGLLETDQGISSVQEKLREMCRFYDELHNIYGQTFSEFPFAIYDTESNAVLNSTPLLEDTIEDQSSFCGFESIEEFCETSVIQYAESENVIDESDCIEIPITVSPPESQETAVSTAEKEPQTNKRVQDFAAKLKRAAPRNSLDQLSLIQNERNSFMKSKLNFEKEKFQQEFSLKERQFLADVTARKEEMEMKERIRKLELEKEERIAKYEIEMKYKYGSKNN